MDKLQFRVSSELKNIIGRDLITDDFIAISELVKNSYDANAKRVEVSFRYIKKGAKNATILITDDGDGMTFDDLKEKWLLVGYSKKREAQKDLAAEAFRGEIRKKRIFAGAKGIGRFSCDKLGSKLQLYTKTEKNDFVDVLHMDWDKFEENPNTQFQEIDVFHEQIAVANNKIFSKFKKGTILKISCLRDQWNRDKLIKLKRHLQRLINPAQIDASEGFSIYIEANEFVDDDERYELETEIVNGLVRNVLFENLGIKTTQINVKVLGEFIVTELYDKGNFIYKLEETKTNEYKQLNNIDIKLFYLNSVAKTAFTKTMGIEPIRYGSVFFYKNGIKVNPYGNAGNDWLGLDRRKTQGTRRFLGNRDLMGRIEVSGYQPSFTEVSSRDGGVTETDDLRLLEELFLIKALRRLEKFVIEGINWDSGTTPMDPQEVRLNSFEIISQLAGSNDTELKKIEFNRDLLKIFSDKQIEKTPEIISNIENIKKVIDNEEDKAYLDLQIKSVRNAFRALQSTKKELEKQLQNKELFLKYVAEDEGGDIAALKHQIGLCTDIINSHILSIKGILERKEQISPEKLESLIDAVLMQTQIINSVSSFLPRAKFERKSQEITQDLVSYVKQYIEKIYVPLNENKLTRTGVNIRVNSPHDIEFKCSFNPYKFVIVIDNLISNSIKANAKNIEISIEVENGEVFVLKFRDDGQGIPDEILSQLFTFGFSTTGGTGIGLYHVKEIIEEDGGQILVNNHTKNGVEFIIRVKKPC